MKSAAENDALHSTALPHVGAGHRVDLVHPAGLAVEPLAQPQAWKMFLTKEDVKGFTRAGTKKAALAWLITNRIPHVVGCDGWPVIAHATIESLLSFPRIGKSRNVVPNYEALRRNHGTKKNC